MADDAPSLGDRLAKWALDHPEITFAILRWIKPILLFKGTAIVTRFEDIEEVLSRDDAFHVTYREKMEAITDGSNFFLGMQNTPEYTRDVSNMRIVIRRSDLDERIAPFVAAEAEGIVARAAGRIDAVQDLTRVVPTRLIGDYFGTPGPNEQDFTDWATVMFWFLFFDSSNDPEVRRRALDAAARTRPYLDGVIQARKADPVERDDVLGRCLKMQAAAVPGMDDLTIRNNFIGLIVGAIPTTSMAAALALDLLLDRPDELAGAQQAARDDDDELLTQYVFEALRFNTFAPGISRLAAQEYVVAKGHFRSTRIPRGANVFAATPSGMSDGRKIRQPRRFRTDRPAHQYLHFGYGLHRCFGYYVNRVQLPGILKPLLKRDNLRRAAGEAGHLKKDGPFPTSMTVEFTP